MAEDDKRSKEKLEETRRVKGEVGEDKADHDERPEKKLEAAGWKSMVELLISWGPPLESERLPAQPRRDDDDRHLPGH